MSILSAPRPATNRKSRPLNVSPLLTIRETDYSVTPIAPGPDNIKAYRLEKLSGDREAYDLAHTNDGLVTCDCKSYVATHEGTISTCKHGSSMILMGLLPKPCCIANAAGTRSTCTNAAPAPADEPKSDRWAGLAEELEPKAPAPYASALAKMTALAEAELVVRSEGRAEHETKVAALVASREAEGRPAPVVKPPLHPTTYDPQWQAALAAVSKGNAIWIDHRHLHTSEPLPVAARETESVPCCDPSELAACSACLDVPAPAERTWDPTVGVEDPRYGPQDDGGGGWDAYGDDRWTISESIPAPAPMPLPEWLDLQVSHHRKIGGDKHPWLAGQQAALADRARFLDATTPDAFDDRLDAFRDVEAVRIEARHAARCC